MGIALSSLIQSVKRLLGKRYHDSDPSWLASLDYDVQECNEDGTEPDQLRIVARIASSTASSSAAASPATTTTLTTTPQHILRLELAALRSALQQYLDRSCRKKQLRIPGGGYQKPRHECRRGCSGAFFTPPSASVKNCLPRRRIYGSGATVSWPVMP